MKQEDHKFKASRNYARRSCFNRKDDDKPRKEGRKEGRLHSMEEKQVRNLAVEESKGPPRMWEGKRTSRNSSNSIRTQ